MAPPLELPALATASFAIAIAGAGALLFDLYDSRYRKPVKPRAHTYRPAAGNPERCDRCSETLDGGDHRPLLCKCPWRVADERCCCTRSRDRYLEPTCVWCRDGQHLTETVAIAQLYA